MKPPLVIIAGATAVGKTKLSVSLAEMINGEIISADSMQVYKGFNIGTDKISPVNMRGIRHFLIDELDADDDFNVFRFKKMAVKYIEDIINCGHIPIIAGGTGFYIQAVLYDIDFNEEDTDKEYRKSLEKIASENGSEILYDMLCNIDPDAASEIHKNNVKRIIRALEFYHETGKRISLHNMEQKARISPYNFAYFVINRDRSEIYNRINLRVDSMFKNGLIDEVKDLLAKGLSRDAQSLQGLGYKETVSYLSGELSAEEAIEKIKLNTRHFAKRQITWFKRENEAIWLNVDEYDENEILDTIFEILKKKNII